MALQTVGTVFVFFAFLSKNSNSYFLSRQNDPERPSGSSRTHLFNSSYNIDPSTMVIRRFEIMRFFC